MAERNFSADWLRKSFTTSSGEKIVFLTTNHILVFSGYGWNRPLHYSYKQHKGGWMSGSKGHRPTHEHSYLTEATTFRKELK